MKTLGLFAVTLFLITSVRAELDTLWTRTVALEENSFSFEAADLLSNGKVIAANSSSEAGVVNLRRFDLWGTPEWTGSTTYDGLPYVNALALEEYFDGQIALVSTYWSEADSANILHVRRMTQDGVVIGDDAYLNWIEPWGSRIGVHATRNNHLMLYVTRPDPLGNPTDLLVKLNASGDTVWTRRMFTEQYGRGSAVRELANGDLIVAGATINDDFTTDGFVMRTNALGDSLWTRIYPTMSFAQLIPQSIDLDNQGNIFCGGYDGYPWWGSYPWAVSLTPNGALRWTLSGMDEVFMTINGIRVLPDGSSMILGAVNSDWGPTFSVIHTVDSDGQADPVPEYMQISEEIRSISANRLGSVAFGGGYSENGVVYGKLFRFGQTTTVTGFVRALGTNLPLQAARVELLETGDFALTDAQGIYLLGVSESSGTIRVTSPCSTPYEEAVELIEGEENIRNFTVGIPDYDNAVSSVNLVATFNMWERETLTVYNDGNGDLRFGTLPIQNAPNSYTWLHVSPSSGVIAPNSSAEIVVSILANSDFPDAEFFGRVEVHHNSCPDTVDEIGVYVLALDTPERPEAVAAFALHSAYPNPFNNTARVAFDLPQTAHVTAKLYSIEGREALTLATQVFQRGTHELSFTGDALATGVYLLRVTAGNFSATQKLVLLK